MCTLHKLLGCRFHNCVFIKLILIVIVCQVWLEFVNTIKFLGLTLWILNGMCLNKVFLSLSSIACFLSLVHHLHQWLFMLTLLCNCLQISSFKSFQLTTKQYLYWKHLLTFATTISLVIDYHHKTLPMLAIKPKVHCFKPLCPWCFFNELSIFC